MLKADLHTHTAEDPFHSFINYSARDLIKYMAKKKYDVLSITLHNKRLFTEDLRRYAKRHGILLIPGMELRMKGMDMVLLNVPEDYRVPTSWRGVRELKRRGALLIASHPFFGMHSLGNLLLEKLHLFDAIEYSHWYHKFFNRNQQAKKIADDFNIPMIGTSDCHRFWQIGHTYTEIDSAKNIDSVLEAIRKGKVRLVTKPLSTLEFLRVPVVMPYDTIVDFFFDNNGYKT